MNNVNTGKIVQISGPVIDVQFESGVLPKIREALSLTVDGRRYVMEVAQHVGDNTVRCVMLSGSEGLSRGMQVEAPGKTIEVPVGENTLGRMFNVLGDPIDGGEAVPATEPHKSIYRKAPSFDEQNPAVEILETGIKVVKIGPWVIGDEAEENWQFSYLPIPTKQCDTCASRRAQGKVPTCVQHCQSKCLEFGPVSELAERMDEKQKTMFVLN